MALEVFKIAGKPFEMGASFGENFRDNIQKLVESRLDHLIVFIKGLYPHAAISKELI